MTGTQPIEKPAQIAGDAETAVPYRTRAYGGQRREAHCPRCVSLETISLDKVEATADTCFRCRNCGHIFSPTA